MAWWRQISRGNKNACLFQTPNPKSSYLEVLSTSVAMFGSSQHAKPPGTWRHLSTTAVDLAISLIP